MATGVIPLQGWEQRVRVISACRVCGNPELRPVIDLGPQSLAGLFDDGRPQNQLATPIPLEVLCCDTARGRGGCGFVQLKHTVPPDIMYQDYGYRSGLNETMRRHLEELSREIESRLKLRAGDIVLDIGANDGTTLLAYRTPGLVRVGFEPSNAGAEAEARGVQILKGSAGEALFFDSVGGARHFLREYPGRKAKAITTIAMFYDIEDPAGFCRQVHRILDEEGLWVAELHYWGSLLETAGFDAICHEHLGYYSLATLEWLFRSTGFELFDVSFNPSNGGSVRCTLVKQRGRLRPLKGDRRRVAQGLDRERQRGYDTAQSHARLRHSALKIRQDLRQVLGEAARSGGRVYGYGASTKGNVLLQYCGLGPADLAAIADRNPMKRGRFTLGSRIPICTEEEMREDHPDLLLILPWHFLDGFLEREKGLRAEGTRFIVPFPQVRIV